MISPLVAGGNLPPKTRARVGANPRHSRAGGNPVHPSGMSPRLRGGDIFPFSPHKGKRANPGCDGYFATGSNRGEDGDLKNKKMLFFVQNEPANI